MYRAKGNTADVIDPVRACNVESQDLPTGRTRGYLVANSVKFGWLSPVIGNRWSDHQPIVMYQEQHILPTALQHFDSLWIADHFYGFDAKTDPFMEAWTTITWLAAKFPDVLLCHHVLGHGYRNPALTAKMAATLQVLSGNRFILGIGVRAARRPHPHLSGDVDPTATELSGHALLDQRSSGTPVAVGGAAGVHRGFGRTSGPPHGGPTGRYVERVDAR